MAIGLSHGGSNIYSSSEQSRQLWVATKDGLVLLERLGDRAWRVSHRALRGLLKIDHAKRLVRGQELASG